MGHSLYHRLYLAALASACVALACSPPGFADLWKDLAREAVHGAVKGAVDQVRSRVGGSRSYGNQDGGAPSSNYSSRSDSSSYSTRVAPGPPEHYSPPESPRSSFDNPGGGNRSGSSADSSGATVKVGGYQNLQLDKPKMSPFDQRAQQTPSWQSASTPGAHEYQTKPDERSNEVGYRYSTARRPVPATRTTKRSTADFSSDVKSEHLVLPGFPGGGLIVKED